MRLIMSLGTSYVICLPLKRILILPVARKVLRTIGDVCGDDITNEIRALDKLCSGDTANVLIQVFHHSRVTGFQLAHDMYQIDMELCLRNLSDQIGAQEISVPQILDKLILAERYGYKTQSRELSQQLSTINKEIVDILCQILKGLEYIHSVNEVHRDLKPENGTPVSIWFIN